jgi:hypothetical protein
MRLLAAVSLACFPAVLAAQSSASSSPAPTHALVRSADATRPVTMQVEVSGGLLTGLGVAPGADGRRVGSIRLSGPGGTATTPAALEVGAEPGVVSFRAPAAGPDIELTLPTGAIARGRVVRLVRDSVTRALHVEASSPAPR